MAERIGCSLVLSRDRLAADWLHLAADQPVSSIPAMAQPIRRYKIGALVRQ